MNRYQETIDRALTHIKNQQSPDGSFISLSGFSTDDFSSAIPRRTTFFTANILACLQNIHGQTATIKSRAAEFLLRERSERWSFNYWSRDALDEKKSPCPRYPDDLDDTFAALAALARHDPGIIDGHVLAAIATLLLAREAVVGGPYRTWIVADDAPAPWQDVDLVVNSTIGYALSVIGAQLPRLENFINGAINKDRLTSPYYPGIFHIGYFLSRFYNHKNGDMEGGGGNDACAKLANILAGRLLKSNKEVVTPLERAMAISSLINLGHAEMVTPGMVETLATRLEREGFRPYAFCIDPVRDGRRCYAGASALTAAFSAEALMYYSTDHPATATVYTPSRDDHIHRLARAACRELDPDLRAAAIAQIEITSDKRITELAYDFREALYTTGVIIPIDIVERLSLANLYGWIAYDVYDDALDGEGNRSLLPCANFFLRMLTDIYLSLEAQIPGARSLFFKTMDRIDGANAWEQAQCRILSGSGGCVPHELPSYGDRKTLADRSIGHAMGPLAELRIAGFTAGSEEYQNVEVFFRHYLIARQLHDDAHDWADDLLCGRINYIGATVLGRFQKKYSDKAAGIPLIEILPELRKIFWKEIIDETTGLILFHIAAARKARDTSRLLNGSDFMECTLRTLESAARRAVKERNEAVIFINEYKPSRPSGARQ